MTGGAHRGPLAPTRQRKTLRFMQGLLAVIAVALFVFAGFTLTRVWGSTRPNSAELGAPTKPSVIQPIVLILLGAGVLAGARALQSPEGIRMPTPARLEELAGRAEKVAIERAEQIAEEQSSATTAEPVQPD
ncbi:MAG: hypothetical protein QOF16_1545 [Actinomycetota bacterium]|nr:hypothetical protein [Actinomycetota bacterium]